MQKGACGRPEISETGGKVTRNAPVGPRGGGGGRTLRIRTREAGLNQKGEKSRPEGVGDSGPAPASGTGGWPPEP